MVYNVGRVRRPLLTDAERLPAHRSFIQSLERNERDWVTGVHSVMYSRGDYPRVIAVVNGLNIYMDTLQGYFFIGGLEPLFGTLEAAATFARGYAAELIPVGQRVDPLSLIGVIGFLLLL